MPAEYAVKRTQKPVWSRQLLLMAGIFAAIAAPARAATGQAPPVAQQANLEHHTGKVVFEDLATPDLARDEAFYGGMFGWTFRDVPGLTYPYVEALLDGRPIAGLVQRPVPAGEHKQSAWLNFFSVPDVDAADRIAVQRGGRLLVPPHDVAGRGRESVLADPQGAVFALLASSTGDPPDTLAEPGAWIWHSVTASDPAAAPAFYKAVLGFEVYAFDDEQGPKHSLLASEDYARASVNALPTGRPNAHPNWLAYIRVNSVAQTVPKLVAGGGRVLAGPWTDRHGGMIAIVSDPEGAPFGLFEWTDTDSTRVGQ